MDPHALALLYHSRIAFQVYEGLVGRDEHFMLEPALAVSWQALDAKTWRFKLRPNVVFHDGTRFTADDVVFSIERAMGKASQRSFQLKGVTQARRVDDLTVDLLLESARRRAAGKAAVRLDDEPRLVAEERRGSVAGLQRQAGDLCRAQRQRHGALSARALRARRAHHAAGPSAMVGRRRQAQRQRHRGQLRADQAGRDAAGGAGFRRDRPRARPAVPGRAAPAGQPAHRAAADPRHRPAVLHLRPGARRAGGRRREGPQSLQGPAGAPGRLPRAGRRR